MDAPDGFREFVEARSFDLLRSAWLLSGDWHTAEDLVQTALVKTWPHWNRLVRRDRPELYVRKVMLTTYLSWRKRRSASELPVADIVNSTADGSGDAEMRQVLMSALKDLPPRQRAVVVLRYFDEPDRNRDRGRARLHGRNGQDTCVACHGASTWCSRPATVLQREVP